MCWCLFVSVPSFVRLFSAGRRMCRAPRAARAAGSTRRYFVPKESSCGCTCVCGGEGAAGSCLTEWTRTWDVRPRPPSSASPSPPNHPHPAKCCCAYLLNLAMHHLFVYMLIQDANSFAITSCATYVFVRLGAPLGAAYVRTRHAHGERIRASVAKLF